MAGFISRDFRSWNFGLALLELLPVHPPHPLREALEGLRSFQVRFSFEEHRLERRLGWVRSYFRLPEEAGPFLSLGTEPASIGD